MSPAEFSNWLEEHRVYRECRDFRSWITKLKRSERGEVLAEWMRLLKPISLDQAKRATKRMHAQGELESVAPERHIPRILEIARTLNDPGAERAREAKREKLLEEQRKVREGVEERFGERLDALGGEELRELAERAFDGNRFLWDFYHRKQGAGEDPRKSKLIRTELLKELRREEVGGEWESPAAAGAQERKSAAVSRAVELDQYRQDVFAGLGEMPAEFRTNDQWERSDGTE